MANPSLDTFSLEKTLRTDPNSVYRAFVAILSQLNPRFEYEIGYLLRKGYPIDEMRKMIAGAFEPDMIEIIMKALIWKRNMLVVGENYWMHAGPTRDQ